MGIRGIIREELKKLIEADYYDNFPDFFDPLYNPQVGAYPPVGSHSYGPGTLVREDDESGSPADFYLEPINNEEVNEGVLEEDYPSSWDVEEFKKLSSFNARIKYCEEHLQRISSGSARIAYKIDDQKVLKLAKNKKGLAQNNVEITQSGYGDIDGVVAQVFEHDEDNLWLEMELARKVKKSDFKRITGFDFDDYAAAINNVGVEHSRRGYKMQIDEDLFQEMWEDEFTSEMFDYIVGYKVPTGDLMKLSTYGVVKRDWGDSIVIIDYGLDKDVLSSHYS